MPLSRRAPSPRASLTLRLAVPRRAEPVKIDAAIVAWTIKDQYFGVKFVEVKTDGPIGIGPIHFRALTSLLRLACFDMSRRTQ
jgi:hypothetical protein